MTSIALAIFTVAIIYVIVWSIKNEDARAIGDQTGFIRMRNPVPATKKPGSGRFAQPAAGIRAAGNPGRAAPGRPLADPPRAGGARRSTSGD